MTVFGVSTGSGDRKQGGDCTGEIGRKLVVLCKNGLLYFI